MKIFFITPYSEKKDYQGEIDKVITIIESTGAEVISAEKTRQYQDIFSEENVKKFGSRENVHYEFIFLKSQYFVFPRPLIILVILFMKISKPFFIPIVH